MYPLPLYTLIKFGDNRTEQGFDDNQSDFVHHLREGNSLPQARQEKWQSLF